jgi:hypothetical protein
MAEPFRLAVSLDEHARDRLRQMAGKGNASVGWLIGRLIESALGEKKRLAAGIMRRMELALRGDLKESERAGVVQVAMTPKLSMEIGDLGAAFDQSAAGMAGLVLKVVLDDDAWTMAVFTDAMNDKGRP